MLKTTLRQHLEQVYPDKELSCWFDPLDVREDKESNEVRISFPHALFGQWFMASVRPNFETHARPFLRSRLLVYACAPFQGNQLPLANNGPNTEAGKDSPGINEGMGNEEGFPPKSAGTNAGARSQKSAPQYTPIGEPPKRLTFASFLVNRKNDFPLAAARAAVSVADDPKYSPFVVYGQSGSGKTHLLGAIANALYEEKPQLFVYYGDIEIFDLMEAAPPLPGRVFIIDNAQRICTDQQIQEQLIRILDKFSAVNTLMVFAFDTHPSTCADISQKLVARLCGGLVLELKKPDIDIRRQYIHRQSEATGVDISKEQELTLAQHYHDFRSIDGVLARIVTYRSTMRQEGDLRSFLEKDDDQKILTPTAIIAVTSKFFSVSPEAITGKSRDKSTALPRQVAMFLIRELLGIPLAQIGILFSGRDHSSIVYAIKKIKESALKNKDTNILLTELKKLCLTGKG